MITGPDGKSRRTFSDISSPKFDRFEEVFRLSQSGMSDKRQSRPAKGGQENPGVKTGRIAKRNRLSRL